VYKDVIVFVIGIFIIIKSADLFTNGAEGIACAFRIPRIVIGLTIVSLATTAPELTVSAISSYMGVGGMAIGNALGSCLANIGLILAIAAIIRSINFNSRILQQELPFLLLILFILYLFMSDNRIGRLDAAFLFLLLAAFFVYIIIREIKSRVKVEEEKALEYNIRKDVLRFLIGALGVVVSAKYAIIPSGINIARFLRVPEVVIGLSMVAVGTSLPELSTAIAASVKNMGELAVGNVIGANILNILLVVGVSALIRPLDVDTQIKMITMPVIIIITLLMLLFSRTRLKLTRWEGLILLGVYVGYIFYIVKFAY